MNWFGSFRRRYQETANQHPIGGFHGDIRTRADGYAHIRRSLGGISIIACQPYNFKTQLVFVGLSPKLTADS